jgi:hypothetical protein
MIDPHKVLKVIDNRRGYIAHNSVLIDVFNGNLTRYIIEDLKAQMSPQAFEQQMHRLCPINILPKICDKLTNIYQTAVTREVINGTPTDSELLTWYAKSFSVNKKMNEANEYYNLTKASLVYPYVANGSPRLRVIKNDRFAVYSEDPIEPNKPTHVILFADKVDGIEIYWVWSDTEFTIMDSRGETRRELMNQYGNPLGINPIGRLPFIYINESPGELYPPQDSDTMKMVKLLPVMCSDLNLAAMFQCFSILYGIDLNDTNLKFAPNAFWSLKSDPTSDKRPEIGSIKPQVDYDQVLNLIQSELTMWLSTKGIRAGSIGTLTPDSVSSGISKLIDEMDTFEARQKQVAVFQEADEALWDLTLNHMHPYWVQSGMIDNAAMFTPYAYVNTKFAVQLPQQTRGQVVRDIKEEFAAGFISRKRALAKLNPEMTAADIDVLLEEVDAERMVPAIGEPVDTQVDGGAAIPAATGVDVQKQALNGSQVESLLSVIGAVTSGAMPKATAKAMIAAAFNLPDVTINDIVDPLDIGAPPIVVGSPPVGR